MSRIDTRGYAKAKICGERIAMERRGHDMTGKAKELNGIAESGQTKKTGDKYPLFNEKKVPRVRQGDICDTRLGV